MRSSEPVVERPLESVDLPPDLDAAEIAIWCGVPRGDPGAGIETLLSLDVLSPEERARLGRFVHVDDRWSYAAAHAGLRLILGGMLGSAPAALCFETGAQGKPSLPGGPFFSLSHTRGRVAVAVGQAPVGVDVETVRDLPDLAALATEAFAPETCAALERTSASARPALFFRHWTLGEAFIKATGLGVSQGLQSFAFSAEGHPRLVRVTAGWGPPGAWQFGLHLPSAEASSAG